MSSRRTGAIALAEAPPPLAAEARAPAPWGRIAGLALVALMPKCPLCLLAMLGLVGSLEAESRLGQLLQTPWLPIAGLVVLGLVVRGIALQLGKGTALGALACAAVLWSAKFFWGSELLVLIVATVSALALLWALRSRRRVRIAAAAGATGACGGSACACAGAGREGGGSPLRPERASPPAP